MNHKLNNLSEIISAPASSVFENTIYNLMNELEIPGVSIALIDDAKVIWRGAYGVRNPVAKQKITNETVFEVASLSKPLFAYAVLKFFREKSIDIDTPLTDFYCEPYTAYDFQDSICKLKHVTARHILSHVAGFSNWDCTDKSMLGKLKFLAGEKFAYSGEGYIYLQRVFEKISGQRLGPYMRKNFLVPLDMPHSSYTWLEKFTHNFADGYGERNTGLDKNWREAFSAYSLYSTPSDYAQILIAMMQEGSKLATQEKDVIDQILTPQISVESFCSWGLGWGLEHTGIGDYYWHWGDAGDYQSFALGSRDHRHGIVIMTNSSNGLLLCEKIIPIFFHIEHPCASRAFLSKIETYQNLPEIL